MRWRHKDESESHHCSGRGRGRAGGRRGRNTHRTPSSFECTETAGQEGFAEGLLGSRATTTKVVRPAVTAPHCTCAPRGGNAGSAACLAPIHRCARLVGQRRCAAGRVECFRLAVHLECSWSTREIVLTLSLRGAVGELRILEPPTYCARWQDADVLAHWHFSFMQTSV